MIETSSPDRPARPWTVEASRAWCERTATGAYENFPVARKLLAGPHGRDVAAIYAFARTVDDITDEPCFEGRRREALTAWEQLLENAFHGDAAHPVFVALHDTVRRHTLPIQPFTAMLVAARMDLTKRRYLCFAELENYCAHAAGPLGQLILFLHGHRDPALHRFGDCLSSGLQLARILERVPADLRRGLCYLPEEDLLHFEVELDDLLAGRPTLAMHELMRFEITRARGLLHRGQPLLRRVCSDLAADLEATLTAGLSILFQLERDIVTAPCPPV